MKTESTNSIVNAVRKVALVTGASAGIGKAIVQRLLSDGWTVYAGARRVERMKDLVDLGARALPLDITDEASMRQFVDSALAAEGRIDALVNNAGYGSYGPVEDVPMDEVRQQFEVNVFGLARMTQLVLPTMRKQGDGTILNITSMGGKMWAPLGGWYHATKHAVEVLSDVLRAETRRFGVRVVIVEPGGIHTEWGGIAAENLRKTSAHSAYSEDGNMVANILQHTKGAEPEVIAKLVSRALKSSRPRRRYAAPFDAKAMIFLTWLLPSWMWEWFIWTTLRMYGRRLRVKPTIA